MMNVVHVSPSLCLAAPPAGAGDEPAEADIDAANDMAPLMVLIVEDEFFIALDIQAQVEALGHVVVGIAVSVEQAIELAEDADVALMDIRLNGVRDGIEAALEIRDRYGVESIFVTANTDPDTLRRAQSIRPAGVLQKPLTRSRLQEQLAQIRIRSDGI
jgi:two-component system, response regulator PdtaR